MVVLWKELATDNDISYWLEHQSPEEPFVFLMDAL